MWCVYEMERERERERRREREREKRYFVVCVCLSERERAYKSDIRRRKILERERGGEREGRGINQSCV